MSAESIIQSATQGSHVAEWLHSVSCVVEVETGCYATDAFLRFVAFSMIPCEVPDEDYEYHALRRLSIDYGIEYLRDAAVEMAITIREMKESLEEVKNGHIMEDFNDVIWEYFGLYGVDVLRCYMTSDKEPNVAREEINEWWLNEMLQDIPGFTAALQEASLAETGNEWWKRWQ